MIFGLSGVSGSGKSTLGKAVAEGLSLPFIPTDITGIAKRAGYKAVGSLKIGERVDLQEALFQGMVKLANDAPGPVIFDRTPLDLVMYLMGEIHMHSHKELTTEQMVWVRDYVKRCQKLTSERFAHVFVTTPLPVYDEVETRPSYNPGYEAHCNLVLMGTLATMLDPLSYSIYRTADFNRRLEAMTGKVVEVLNANEEKRRSSLHIH